MQGSTPDRGIGRHTNNRPDIDPLQRLSKFLVSILHGFAEIRIALLEVAHLNPPAQLHKTVVQSLDKIRLVTAHPDSDRGTVACHDPEYMVLVFSRRMPGTEEG